MESSASADAVARLDELTRKLRRECPWDREQDERSIVPHTVGEAYELAQAAEDGDDAKLLDELGDVLFQVHFLSLLLEERGHGSLAEAKETIKQTLASQGQQQALDKFVKDFTKRWKEKTECSEGYKTTDCKNGPKATPTPTAPATDPTQQVPSQQVPEQATPSATPEK